MPRIARKVVICAGDDGVLIHPLSPKGQRPLSPVQVKYRDASIYAVPRDQGPNSRDSESASFEAYGVIGLITVSGLSYLITIVHREQVAQIWGWPVYVVTEVAVTPCSSKQDADTAILSTARQIQQQASKNSGTSNDDSGAESSEDDTDLPDDIMGEVGVSSSYSANDVDISKPKSARTSFAEDVMSKRGSYGRFAQRWFSRSGWTLDQRRTLGMSNSTTADISPDVNRESFLPVEAGTPQKIYDCTEIPVSALLPKLLRTVEVLFGSSRSFYFSYDMDITRHLAEKSFSLATTERPLHAKVDDAFFWNQNILQPFLNAGLDALALPVMQGFIGQRTFVVDSEPPQTDEPTKESLELQNMSAKDSHSLSSTGKTQESVGSRLSEKSFLITLISRRSTKRAGLRYLRRGINEDGYTANMVETEQLLSSPAWEESSPVHSFLQIRGSIPLFFTQSAYSLKPVPNLQHSVETNYRACKRHFERLSHKYGALQVVNLVEKHGIEEPIGTNYQNAVQRLNEERTDEDNIPFEWFDFHHACRGMKFENVSQLLTILKDKLEELGSTTQKENSLVQTQKGIVRTNCMDCLDRTNVCQSSFAKHMLDLQLRGEDIDMSAQLDQETAWFNTLWADNGDAVSKQYASTAAMKGDYTRTRKRDYRGALNDLGLSLARLYSGMVNDYFSQAAIDFLLGNVTGNVFDEFEADMMTKDPALSVPKMRERAIELCQKRVVADEREDFHGGWVLISPKSPDVIKSWPMIDVVLLLTDAALYLCRFDWDLDKVASFERVQLGSITHIKFGTYITSTTSLSNIDEMKNVGFVVSYQPGKTDIKRTNTRTLSSRVAVTLKPDPDETKSPNRSSAFGNIFLPKPKIASDKKIAFKAPFIDYSTSMAAAGPQQTEIQQVVTICAEIERLVLERQLEVNGNNRESIVEEGEIISLEAAKRNTGLLEQLGHSIKKLVWA